MRANRLCKLVLLFLALASLDQASAFASPPKKALGPAAPRAVIADVPVAEKQLKPGTPPARHPLTPSASSKLLGGGGLPDLVPAAFFPTPAVVGLPAGFPGVQYCDPNPAGGTPNKVRYRVRNQGMSSAPPFSIRFDFVGAGQVVVPVDGLSQGNEKSGAVNIPAGCYPPGFSTACQFTITVDSNAQIGEANEANNSAQSYCVGPAG